MKRLPIVDTPRQNFTVRFDGHAYSLELVWNTVAAAFYLSIDVDGIRAVTGLRVTLGTDLFRGISSSVLIAINASDTDTPITYESLVLGDVRLYLISEQELVS